MNLIKNRSHFFRIIFQILFFLTPVERAFYWISTYYYSPNMFSKMPGKHVHLPWIAQLSGFLVSMLPAIVMMFIFYQLIQLFRSYEQVKIFNTCNVKRYHNIGYGIILYILAGWLTGFLNSFIFSFSIQPFYMDYRFIHFPRDLMMLITGFIIILIASIMTEGHKISKNYEEII